MQGASDRPEKSSFLLVASCCFPLYFLPLRALLSPISATGDGLVRGLHPDPRLDGSGRFCLYYRLSALLVIQQTVEIGFIENQVSGFRFAEFPNGIGMPYLVFEILHLALGQWNKRFVFHLFLLFPETLWSACSTCGSFRGANLLLLLLLW